VTRRALAAVLASEDAMGVLARETRARLVNVSASGCLLESACGLAPGTTGTLEIVVRGETYGDAVRVTRAQRLAGSSGAWHLGIEFLWTSHPSSRSLRRMAGQLRGELAQQAVMVAFSTVGPM
jgi:hypothetical protein